MDRFLDHRSNAAFESLENRFHFATIALPDLVTLRDSNSFNPYVDKTSMQGRTLLRFGTTFGNIGAGPLVLTADPTDVNPDGTETVRQSLYRYSRSANRYEKVSERIAGDFIFHPEHEHFHFDGYASYELFRSRKGKAYQLAKRSDGTPVLGDKVSFCLSDGISSFQVPGTSKSSRKLPGYTAAGQPDVGCGLAQGLHVGMADSYDSSIDGQWVDVTGVAAGNYFLVVKLDSQNVIEESNETNNEISVPVTLRSTKPSATNPIRPDRYESNTPTGRPNDTMPDAIDLGTQGSSAVAGLTLHSSVDEDWFSFKAAVSGRFSVKTISTDFDADLYLYNSAGRHLIQATVPGFASPLRPVSEEVNYNFVAGQRYFVQAKGFVGNSEEGTCRDYALRFALPFRVAVTTQRQIANRLTGQSASVTFYRQGPLNTPLNIHYVISGTARSGHDFKPLSGVIKFGDYAAARTIHVEPVQGTLSNSPESLVLTIIDGPDYRADRKLGRALLQIS